MKINKKKVIAEVKKVKAQLAKAEAKAKEARRKVDSAIRKNPERAIAIAAAAGAVLGAVALALRKRR